MYISISTYNKSSISNQIVYFEQEVVINGAHLLNHANLCFTNKELYDLLTTQNSLTNSIEKIFIGSKTNCYLFY